MEARKLLLKKVQQINQIIVGAETYLAGAPEGSLRINTSNKTVQYYRRKERDNSKCKEERNSLGTYIKKSETQLIQALAQKDYEKKLLAKAKKQQIYIKKFLENYAPKELEEVYEKLPMERKRLATPHVLSDEEFARQWKEKKYQGKEMVMDSGIYTENNEIVRSKSEKILADKLNAMGVPYHYEMPLQLNGYGLVYPDFTVLNKKTRKEYYWEHLGMMDNKEYCEKTIKKLETMARNGIFPGKNLILTYETADYPINAKTVELLIKEYLVN